MAPLERQSPLPVINLQKAQKMMGLGPECDG